MAHKKHYTIDNENKIVRAIIVDLTEKEKKEIRNYLDLGYTLSEVEKPKKQKATEEEKEKNPFSEKNIQAFLKDNATKQQQEAYWELYNEQAKDKATGKPAVYKTDSKKGSAKVFKKGDPKPKGHIATLQWFKQTFKDYPKAQ